MAVTMEELTLMIGLSSMGSPGFMTQRGNFENIIGSSGIGKFCSAYNKYLSKMYAC